MWSTARAVTLVGSLVFSTTFLSETVHGETIPIAPPDEGSCPIQPDCCEEDCCGPQTSWDPNNNECVPDPSSGGFDGTYSPGHVFGCVFRECCEGVGESLLPLEPPGAPCCGQGTVFDQATKYCVLSAPPVSSSPVQLELDAARDRWSACGFEDYEFHTQRSCFCPPEFFSEMYALVTDGSIEAVYSDEALTDFSGEPLFGRNVSDSSAVPPTIEGQFVEIQKAIDGGAYSISVTYDEACGYPLNIAINYDEFIADEEYYRFNRGLIPVASISRPCNELDGSTAGCSSDLIRRSGSLTVKLTQLENFSSGHAFTIWFASCSNSPCDPENGEQQLYNLGGFVTDPSLSLPLVYNVPDYQVQGDGSIPDACPGDVPPGECVLYDPSDFCAIIFPRKCEQGVVCSDYDLSGIGTGLQNAQNDDIVLWFKDHGSYDDTATYPANNDPLNTFNGQCTAETVYFPKAICPMDGNPNSCADIASLPFQP